MNMKNFSVSKTTQRLFLSAALTALVVLLLLILFPEHYETGDDFWINSIASGLNTERDYHLVFNNILLGELLVALNTALPQIPWYGLLQYAVSYLSLTVIVFLILEKKVPFAPVLIGTLLPVFGYELFIRAEFTKVSLPHLMQKHINRSFASY